MDLIYIIGIKTETMTLASEHNKHDRIIIVRVCGGRI